MSAPVREKFSSQASPQVLAALRRIAQVEGRQFQAVLDEALRDYIERKKGGSRQRVVNAFARSVEEFDSLYRELAK